MHKKNGKVYATLTDVKNLIGDVFAAVDEYGEVAITSYNKTKYLITKAPSVDINEIVEEFGPRTRKSNKPSRDVSAPNPVKEVETKTLPVAEVASSTNLLAEAAMTREPQSSHENKEVGAKTTKEESNFFETQVEAEIVEQIEEKQPEVKVSEASESATLLETFKQSAEREFFERTSDKEKSWVNKAKLNF